MPINPIKKEIKEARFINALVESAGNAKEAYKAIVPQITDGSAKTQGSRMLSTLDQDSTKAIIEKVGCTKEKVLENLWERMKKTKKDETYIKGTSVLAKIAGWQGQEDKFRDLMADGLDLVEIIKVRLRKSNDNKPLQQPIDIPCTSKDNLVSDVISDGTATESNK